MVRLIRAELRKDKITLIALMLIVTIASLMMNMGLMSTRYNDLYEEYRDETGLADYIAYIMAGEGSTEGILDDKDYIEKYETTDIVMLNNFKFGVNGAAADTNAAEWIFQDMENAEKTGEIIFDERDDSVSGNKIYMNIYTALSNNLKIGDTIHIESGLGSFDYTLAGTYQHLMMGSTYTYYSVIVEPEEMADLIEKRDNAAALYGVENMGWDHMISVFVKDGYDAEKCLKDTKESLIAEQHFPADGFGNVEGSQAYTAITNILAAFMAAFAVIILGVAVVMIVFTVNNNINRDVTNIGALKSVGFTTGQIRRAMVAEYTAVTFAGGLLGTGLSYIVWPVLEKLYIRQISGLIRKDEFYPGYTALVVGGAMAVAVITTFLMTARVKTLHPATALRFGFRSGEYEHNRLPLEETQRGEVNALLGIKSFLMNRAQNIIVICVIATVAFVTMFSCVLYYNTNVDISRFQRMVQGDVADGYIHVNDGSPEALAVTCRNLEEMDEITHAYGMNFSYAYVDDTETNVIYVNDPSAMSFLLYEGRVMETADETVVGSMLADTLGVGVGDDLTVSYGGRQMTFKITGLQQSAVNNRFYIVEEAAEELGVAVHYDYIRISVDSASADKVDRVIEKALTLGDPNITGGENVYRFDHSDENTPVFAMGLMVLLLVSLNLMTVMLVIGLVIKTSLTKLEKEFGIKKALGFTSRQLRLQLSISLMPPVVIAAVAGAVGGFFGTNPLFEVVLGSYGIKKSDLIVRPELAVASLLAVTVTVLVISYVMSWRMKRISAYNLMRE